jgi:phosphatidylserine/phosphatidylglycerophosphate/cardiolipin synthase-like enzyme
MAADPVDPIDPNKKKIRPVDDPLETAPPRLLEQRVPTVFVQGQATLVNTLRMPNDPKHAEKERWFNPPGTVDNPASNNVMPEIHPNNEVTFLIDGADFPQNTQPGQGATARTFVKYEEAIESAIEAAIETDGEQGPYIYMLNWWFEDELVFGHGSRMRDLLHRAQKNNVQVRGMFWLQKSLSFGLFVHYLTPVLGRIASIALGPFGSAVLGEIHGVLKGVLNELKRAVDFSGDIEAFGISGVQNHAEVLRINLTERGAAILDDRTLDFGSHHQKMLIVKNSKEIVAFCGGIDFNTDRLKTTGTAHSSSGTRSSPLHDVHCQVRGPAAIDMLRIFTDRWNEYVKKDDDDRLSNQFKDTVPPADDIQSAAKDSDLRNLFIDKEGDEVLRLFKGQLAKKLRLPLLGFADVQKFDKSAIGPDPSGEQFVQIGRTFGNGDKDTGHAGIDFDPIEGKLPSSIFSLIPGVSILFGIADDVARFVNCKGYDFRPKGEQTARRLLIHALQQAKRFIYIEDQYLVNPEISKLLLDALDRVEHITILLPHGTIGDQPDGRFHRHKFLAPLVKKGNTFTHQKVRVYCRGERVEEAEVAGLSKDEQKFVISRKGVHYRVNIPHAYIHAKCVIVDDRFASIGSVNCNRRGWTWDSEVTAGIFDESHDDKMTLHFAHRLRMKLWAEHLKMDTEAGHAELWDGVASSILWDRPAPLTRVVPYIDPTGDFETDDEDGKESNRPLGGVVFNTLKRIPVLGIINRDTLFDRVVDPDGNKK